MKPHLVFASLDDVLRHLDTRGPAALRVRGGWSVGRTLAHCAQSIELSLTGYPALKPALLRKTLGRFVLGRFLARGFLSHDLEADVPGAPLVADETPTRGAERLALAIGAFRSHRGPLAPHFFYGEVTAGDYDRVHAMHCADHLAPEPAG